MYKVKCNIATFCYGNDRDYYRKPKEFIFDKEFKYKESAEQFIDMLKTINTSPNRDRYSDFEIIEILDENFDIYNKNQKYKIIYSDKEGKEKEFEYTPEEDMTKPKMITQCKNANKDFVKLKEIKKLEEGVDKMKEEIKTLADLLKNRHDKELDGLDVGDNTIDMIIYYDYIEDSSDPFDKCLKTIAEKTRIIEIPNEDYAIVDFYNFVKDNLDAFENRFNLESVSKDDKIDEIVEEIIPGLVAGNTGDTTYTRLNDDLIKNKIEENKDINKDEILASNILTVIDNYIDPDDIDYLFKRLGITEDIYEGDKDIPADKINIIITEGLDWLFEHLLPEDYKRVVTSDLGLVSKEDLERFGIDLEESKKIEESKINYNEKINQLIEEAQYNMGLDEFYNFLKLTKEIVDKKLEDNEIINKED